MSAQPSQPGHFGPTHTIEPRPGHSHTHTAILLHGRGSSGQEFAEELFATEMSGFQEHAQTLADRLPTWRWVFPSSPSSWNDTFEEWMPAWFEARSLADPTSRQDLQQPGLAASVQHMGEIIERELHTLMLSLKDETSIVLGGISLGGAVALWTLLSTRTPEQPLGGLAVMSAWLPFASEIERFLSVAGDADSSGNGDTSSTTFVSNMLSPLRDHLSNAKHIKDHSLETSALSTPMFVGHGQDDAYVDVDLGKQAVNVLASVGFVFAGSSWREYEGAEQEGHWIKEPEEMDDLAAFLETIDRGVPR